MIQNQLSREADFITARSAENFIVRIMPHENRLTVRTAAADWGGRNERILRNIVVRTLRNVYMLMDLQEQTC